MNGTALSLSHFFVEQQVRRNIRGGIALYTEHNSPGRRARFFREAARLTAELPSVEAVIADLLEVAGGDAEPTKPYTREEAAMLAARVARRDGVGFGAYSGHVFQRTVDTIEAGMRAEWRRDDQARTASKGLAA